MNRKLVMITGGAVVLVVGLWFMFLWGPQGGRLVDAQDREDAADTTNSELQLRLARLQAASARAPQLTADLEHLRQAVPDDPALPAFLLDANAAAAAAGVDYLSIAPTPPAANADPALPSVISLQISVNGGYDQVLDYLDRLSSLPRIVVIDTLGLAPGEAVGDQLGLSVSVSARMFTTSVPLVGGEIPVATTPSTTPPDPDPASSPVPAPDAGTDSVALPLGSTTTVAR